MNHCDFDRVCTGMEIQKVIRCHGQPYSVCSTKRDGVKKYVYIERIDVAPDRREQYHYIFHVKEGRVISKCVRHHESAFDFTHEYN